MAGDSRRPTRSLVAKIGLALFATLVTLGALEIAARVAGRGADDPALPSGKLPAPKSIDVAKLFDQLSGGEAVTDDTFNIYYFGGSTMASGHFVALIGHLLGTRVHGRPIRSFNLAVDAGNLSHGYDRLRAVLDDRERFRPHVCVVYSGHNEFLEFHAPRRSGVALDRSYPGILGLVARHSSLLRVILDRSDSYRLEIDERRFFDEPLFGPDGYDAVVTTFARRLAAMTGWLEQAGIPVVISTVAGNASEWEPNRSIYCGAEEKRNSFRALMTDGDRMAERGDPEAAVRAYGAALEICPTFAETHFRLGKALQALGRPDDAWQAFRNAIAHDGMPIRALPAQNEFIRELGEAGRARVVDAVAALRSKAHDGLIGFNLMMDGHHPNERGYGCIAGLIAREIARIADVPDRERIHLDDARVERFFGWRRPPRAFRFFVGRGRWFSRLATWRFDPEARLRLAEESFLRAQSIDRTRYESHLGLAIVHYLRLDAETADRYLATASRIDEGAVRSYVARPWIDSVIRRALRSGGD